VLAREALRDQATHDGLTGLLNRAAILELLQNELLRCGRERQPVSVLLADLDRFKQINDTFGHQTGDVVLCEVARRMKSVVRRYDAVGRYGGEEFLIVLPGCDGEVAAAQAQRIREAITVSPIVSGMISLQVTGSIGVSWRGATGNSDTNGLVRDADLALYRAKDAGRDRVELATVESKAPDITSLAVALAQDT